MRVDITVSYREAELKAAMNAHAVRLEVAGYVNKVRLRGLRYAL